MTATAGQIPPAVRDAITQLVDYNWASEERDYAECGTGPDCNSRQGHVYESLVRVRRWLDGHDDGHVTTEVWVPDPGRDGCMMMGRRKSAREVLAEITAILGPEHDSAGAHLPLQVSGADREWPEGPVKVSGIAGFPDGRYVHVEVLRVHAGITEADIILAAEFDDLEAGRHLARRLRSILRV